MLSIVGDELLSDSYDPKEVEDFFLEVEGKVTVAKSSPSILGDNLRCPAYVRG